MRIAINFTIIIFLSFISGCNSGVHVRSSQYDVYIDISPDSQYLIFNAIGKGGSDLYRLRLSDNKITNITHSDAYETTPSFSPDGKSIVYASGLPGDTADHIYICDTNGYNRRRITNDQYNDGQPSFSPDGKTIVFTRNHRYAFGGLSTSWPGEMDVYIVGTNDSEVKQITHQSYAWINTPRFLSNKSVIYSANLNSEKVEQLKTASRIQLKENRELVNEGNLYRVDIPHADSLSPQLIEVKGDASVVDYSAASQTLLACISDQLQLLHFDNSLVTIPIKKIQKNDIRSAVISSNGNSIYFVADEPVPTPNSDKSLFADVFHIWHVQADGKHSRKIITLSPDPTTYR